VLLLRLRVTRRVRVSVRVEYTSALAEAISVGDAPCGEEVEGGPKGAMSAVMSPRVKDRYA